MASQWIDITRKGPCPVTLFCFPYSGGSAQVYLNFPRHLPPDVRVLAYEPPGRGRRFIDKLVGSLDDMLEDAFRDYESYVKEGAFMFFGHSLGGLAAFEMARKLRRRGLPMPSHLFVSGVRAPQVPRREGNAHELPFDEFVGKLKEMGGTHDEIMNNREMLELMVPILKKDFQCYETYAYREEDPLACPVTALGGRQDRFVLAGDVEEWSRHSSADFSVRFFQGGHFFVHTDMAEVCRCIGERGGFA